MNITKNTPSSNGHMSVEGMDKQASFEMIERENIEDTPFTIITTEEESFGVMGKYRLTEAKKTKEEVEEELKEITWNRITQVIQLLIQLNTEN